jgi:hypothetical protein
MSANYYDCVSFLNIRHGSGLHILNVHDSGICMRSRSLEMKVSGNSGRFFEIEAKSMEFY